MTLDAKKWIRTERELLEAVQHARAEYEDLSVEYLRVMDTVAGVGPRVSDGLRALVRCLDSHRTLHSAIEELQQRAA